MKKHITLLLALALFAFIFVSSLQVNSFSGEPPVVLSNIVEDAGGSTCNSCHGTGETGSIPETGGISFTLSDDDTYTLDSTYDVTIKVDTPGKRNGFQIIALDSDGNSVGSITPVSANSQTKTGGSKNATHLTHKNLPGDTDGIVEFKWQAPSSDEGEITFYAIMVAADGNSGTSNDKVYFASQSLTLASNASARNISAWDATVFPTVTEGNVYLESKTSMANYVQVYDILGNSVFQSTLNPGQNKLFSFQDFGATTGWHLVVINSKEGQLTKRVFFKN